VTAFSDSGSTPKPPAGRGTGPHSRRTPSGPILSREALGLTPEQTREYEVSSALFSGILNSTADGILVVSPTGELVAWNRMFEELWRVPREVLEGRRVERAREHVAQQLTDPDAFLRGIRKLYESPEADSADPLTLADGRVFEAVSRPLRLHGQPNGRVWSFRDVTERVRSERSHLEAEERFRAFAEGAACGLIVYREDRVLFANQYLRDLAPSGLATVESFLESVHPDDRDLVRQRGRARLRGEPLPARYEIRVRNAAGETRWLELTGQLIKFENQPAALVTMYDVTDRRIAEERTKHVAFHDGLTDLPNRALFQDRAEAALALARRDGAPLALAFLDVDRFKIVNDSLGHAVGDELIRGVAARLRSLLRESDTVARIGGDEFALLLAGVGTAEAPRLARKVLDAFRAPFLAGGRELHVTTSLGIALYPTDGADVATLLKNADIAMYQAKEGGRDRSQLFDRAMNENARRTLELENDMYLAIAHNEFIVYYQPIVHCASDQIESFEALVRWSRRGGTLIEPSNFIPLAESTGMIQPLGLMILRQACFDATRLRAAAGRDVRISVNIAAGQLREPTFVEQVADVLREANLPADALELEITESSALQDQERTIETLRDLVALGLSISLDDFGTGYASLDLLRRMPVSRIKIDRTFVHDIGQDPVDAAIASATVALAHKLDLTVVAEGVETDKQREYLESHQCDFVQGYLLGKPVPIEATLAMLALIRAGH
jgi:diguanylate cyclase (GGDEF)-like protein/PAS domain S-box-containing protein